MKEYSIHIDPAGLSKLLQTIFDRLPKEYFKAFEGFSKNRSKSYFRESLISRWISIPVSKNILFEDFRETNRLNGIFIPTIDNTKVEIQMYLNRHGIIGVKIADDLENLIIDNTDTSQFVIEKVPTSKFLTGSADLEYLDDFDEIDEYLDNKYTSETFTIDNVQYCSIITISDKKCIAIDDNKFVYLLNKESGLKKLIFKRPEEFVRAFKDKKLNWFNEL
jgi:hypothetical protein